MYDVVRFLHVTRFQEVMILSALSSSELTPRQMSQKIKKIVSWAKFQRAEGGKKNGTPPFMELD